jgi:Tol biopolymer transport system component
LQPSWSPDGRSLAVVACQHWSSSGCTFSTVMVMAVDGSGFKTLANTTGFARPTWTADGSALLFSRWCADGACQSGLYQVAAAGGGDRLVMADAHSGVWRP